MIKLNIQDEFSPLEAVILGRARGTGPAPLLEEAYDPKSAQHIKAGTYPAEDDMVTEMDAVADVFKKYGVTVYRPEIIPDYNQIFARDIGFTIEDLFFKANILPERDKEIEAIQSIIDQMDPSKVITFPEEAHVEGGDVMPHNDYIFVGTYRGADYSDFITARTNHHAVEFLQKTFPNKKVKSFDLRKSNTVAEDNALHLDCCFQPIGKGKCIIHKEGFLVEEEYNWLVDYFGKENCFQIDKKEMYNMFSNIFSISEDVVISERNFTRLNQWLEQQGFTVEKVPYFEISKQEGLLRCSTLPLRRSK
ncbi:MAG: amidinotransferase [Flavobacteriaceae bacterium]|nr:amidinotransferase [Flavobacteriaceae bacterium]